MLRLSMILCVVFLSACQTRPDTGVCGDSSTAVHNIQGDNQSSPLLGQSVQLEVITTLTIEGSEDGPSGVFAQQPDDQTDDSDQTSEGILLLDASLPLQHRVRVTGVVVESGDERQSITALDVQNSTDCGAADEPAPVDVQLPVSGRHIESLEGMLVRIREPLTISGVSNLRRAGELNVAAGGRLYQPTEKRMPGQDAEALRRDNLKRSLILDDASLLAYPASIPHLSIESLPWSLPRVGDQVTEVTGVMNHWRGYRIHISQPATLKQGAVVQELPAPSGNLRVVGFNVLNLFNGDGRGGGFPTERGAQTLRQLERQITKTVSAMTLLDADLFALAELENDGHLPDSAVLDLVSALNERSSGAFEVIGSPTSDQSLGDDSIAVGMIYRSSVLRPLGDSMTLSAKPFDDLNRQPLLQRFEHLPTGQTLAVVSLHLKSKSCRNAEGPNADQRDGQGCWNPTRLEAARRLTRWAEESAELDPGTTLFIGDLNAYSMEDPVQHFIRSGYENLVKSHSSKPTLVSYVYRGQAGALDHALAGTELSAHATAAFIWSINSGLSDWLSYRQEGGDDEYYRPDHWRSSDHDPVVVDFSLPDALIELR